MIDKRLEKTVLSQADMLTTTSEPLADKLWRLHRHIKVEAIPHGFDPDTLNSSPSKVTDKFTITYTGSFERIKRSPSMLLLALRNLINQGIIDKEVIEVRFYGKQDSWIEDEIRSYLLSDIVKQYGYISMQESQTRQRESQLLFLPKWDDYNERGIHSYKLFEYLAARRPILATGEYRDVVNDLLVETNAGVCQSTVLDTENALLKAYQEYKDNGIVIWKGNELAINKYSQRETAKKFANLLEGIK